MPEKSLKDYENQKIVEDLVNLIRVQLTNLFNKIEVLKNKKQEDEKLIKELEDHLTSADFEIDELKEQIKKLKTGKLTIDKYLTFGEAIEALKQGKRVARKGWNGKGMFLYLEEFELSVISINKDYDYEPCLVMYTAQGKWQPGWLASQTDILAEDWEAFVMAKGR